MRPRTQGVSRIYTRDEKCLPLKPVSSGKTSSAKADDEDERKPYAPQMRMARSSSAMYVKVMDVLQHPEWKPDECDTLLVKKAQQPLRLASAETRKKFMDPKLGDRAHFKPSSVSKTKYTPPVFSKRIHVASLGRRR